MNRTILRRGLIFLLSLSFIGGGVYFNKKLSAQKEAPPTRPKAAAPVPPVKTLVANNENVSTTLNVQGELVAFEKVDLYTEVTGVLEETSKPFKKGTYFPKGSLLLSVDDEEARLSILSQKSNLMNAVTQMMPDLKIDYPESFVNWQTYLQNFDVTQSLKAFPQPVNDQEKYFVASRNLQTQFYNIKSAEARLDKYKIYAPFSGVLLDGNFNIGTLVRANQQIGILMNTGNYELEATVALGDLKFIKTGNPVKLTSTDINGNWNGRIKRIDNQIDPRSQTVTVYIGVSGKNLREGMYLAGEIKGSSIGTGVRIPRELLVNQRAVYTVKDSTLNLVDVNVVKITESSAILRGIEDGTVLLGENLSTAYDGMQVRPES